MGGGTKSQAWLQIVSDVAGISQEVPYLTIGASYGDAFLAGKAAGLLQHADIYRWVRPMSRVQANPSRKPIYDALYADYRLLYDQTRDIVHRLSYKSS